MMVEGNQKEDDKLGMWWNQTNQANNSLNTNKGLNNSKQIESKMEECSCTGNQGYPKL